MIYNYYNTLANTFDLFEDEELDMIGCSLIIVLRDILVCSILTNTCMQGLYTNNCLEVNLFYISCRKQTTFLIILTYYFSYYSDKSDSPISIRPILFFDQNNQTCFQTTIQNHHLNNC